MWPPAAVNAPVPALAVDPSKCLTQDVDRWTCPDLKASVVKDVIAFDDGVVLLLDGCPDLVGGSRLALWRPDLSLASPAAAWSSSSDNQGAKTDVLIPLILESCSESPLKCSAVWPGGSSWFFAQCGDSVWRVAFSCAGGASAAASGDPVALVASLLVSLPPRVCSLHCSATTDGGLYCVMIVRPAPTEFNGPIVVVPGQSLQQTPAAKLCVFDARVGLRHVADAPRLSEELVVSRGKRKICVWRAMLNEVPEEAERGEFLGCELPEITNRHSPNVQCLTSGAGRVGLAAVSDDGELLLLQANFSATRPVTTHMALVLIRWPSGEPCPRPERQAITECSHVHSFGFLSTADAFSSSVELVPRVSYVTILNGVDAETKLWRFGHERGPEPDAAPLPFAVLSKSASVSHTSGAFQQGMIAYGTERAEALPEAVTVSLPTPSSASSPPRVLALPQPDGAAGFKVEKIVYKHQGEEVTALLCERTDPPCPPGAPLLVHAHGGPAIGVLRSRRMTMDASRYPYRHFLAAGYRVFQPLFRGTLGFGDKWSQGNIGSQGSKTGDLGDILAGLDWLNGNHPHLRGTIEPSRTGIFGGSYGGYMTIRALVEAPGRFAAGVALYGFVHNRWMSYEGGDFTWEDEYIMPIELQETDAEADPSFQIEMIEEEFSPSADDRRSHCNDGGRRIAQRNRASGRASPSSSPTMAPAKDAADPLRGRQASPISSPRSAGSLAPSAASDVWPLPRDMEASDTFNGLHRICEPLLLMHGEKDDICHLSQSQVVFHMLEKNGVPTGLIIYPGEALFRGTQCAILCAFTRLRSEASASRLL
eukprot:TRINITY_DN1828_c0_g1_i1.p1 TRINITY_DN1828_c0_g1~~TRINITY_DN1828_c0_g1_i1.p1  ORF type:complete len:820 (+),score=138.04 TRINITY_DN1828_c0_g1_i1:46-2505(+)